MANKDKLVRFLFENTHVRGQLVQLEASWQEILKRHEYPNVIRDLLGEAFAATALLSATIRYARNKNPGSLVLQIQGSGPLNLLVVHIDANGFIRGTVDWTQLPTKKQTRLTDLFVDGRLAITIDLGQQGERYQSIVDLGDAGIREAIEGYFRQSEQINTHIWLASNGQVCAGLLIQEMPDHENEKQADEDIWNRVGQLSNTISFDELLNLDSEQVIHRLYHEEDVRVFEPEMISFRCSCSKDRIIDVLRNLGQAEVQSIIEDEGRVSVNCEYCKQEYVFDLVDVEQIFAAVVQTEVPKTRH